MKTLLKSLFCLVTLILIGCATSADLADEKLSPGMTQAQVEEILGSPTMKSEAENGIEKWTYIDRVQGMFLYVELKFVNGKYVSWHHSGSAPIGGDSFIDSNMESTYRTNQQIQQLQTQQNQTNFNNMLNNVRH